MTSITLALLRATSRLRTGSEAASTSPVRPSRKRAVGTWRRMPGRLPTT